MAPERPQLRGDTAEPRPRHPGTRAKLPGQIRLWASREGPGVLRSGTGRRETEPGQTMPDTRTMGPVQLASRSKTSGPTSENLTTGGALPIRDDLREGKGASRFAVSTTESEEMRPSREMPGSNTEDSPQATPRNGSELPSSENCSTSTAASDCAGLFVNNSEPSFAKFMGNKQGPSRASPWTDTPEPVQARLRGESGKSVRQPCKVNSDVPKQAKPLGGSCKPKLM